MKRIITQKLRVADFMIAGALLLTGPGSATAAFINLFAYGDSLSDAGNAYVLSGGAVYPPPYVARASNGPVAVERLAADLGISGFAPSTSGGTDYAVGGATTSSVNTYIFDNITALANTGIQAQVLNFVAAPPIFDPATSLFFVWGGPNDVELALLTNQDPVAAAGQAIVNLANEIALLAGVGAEHFLVPNLADLGLTPRGSSTNPTGLSLLSQGFNLGLASVLGGLETTLGLDIVEFDTFGFFRGVVENAASYGFTNVTDPCFDKLTSVVCANPHQYLFWDDLHPTARAHEILGDRFYVALPEPGTLALLAFMLAGLVLTAPRKKSGTTPLAPPHRCFTPTEANRWPVMPH